MYVSPTPPALGSVAVFKRLSSSYTNTSLPMPLMLPLPSYSYVPVEHGKPGGVHVLFARGVSAADGRGVAGRDTGAASTEPRTVTAATCGSRATRPERAMESSRMTLPSSILTSFAAYVSEIGRASCR